MSTECLDCHYQFNEEGQNGPHIQPATQCPQCHGYRTQPAGIPTEANDMLHGLDAMPTSTQDDMSGNPLKEGILADNGIKPRNRRDESFASVKRADVSLFETPEFETTQIVAPPDLYRHGMETEAAHRAHVQTPQGITDNLHAALGNLGAWVENPYENGQLRPYYNKYWKVIRPSFMKPGSLQIGVAEPTMAEIINHVAQTDDLAPLYEYRGKTSSHHTAGPLMAMLPEGIAAGLAGGGADAAGAAAADAAGGAAAGETGIGAGGVGSVMNNVMKMNPLDDALGTGGGQGGGGGYGGGGGAIPQTPHDFSFYANEDDAYPAVHGEIPQNEDGDHKQQDDGNNHEWQRDISVDGTGGSQHSPSFDAGGPAIQRLMMHAPLLLQYLNSGEDGSQDPLIQALHEALEAEVPGYRDHADDEAGKQLIMVHSPEASGESSKPEAQEETHTDENSGGGHESKTAALYSSLSIGGDFLPDLDVVLPSLNGVNHQSNIQTLYQIAELSKGLPPDIQYEITRMLRGGEDQAALAYLQNMTRSDSPQPEESGNPYFDSMTPIVAKTADTQGPQTPEQIKAVQQFLFTHGHELGLEGDELWQTILSVPTNPLDFADILAKVQQAEGPPTPPQQDAGMSANPPMPAQENAPPGATMPMPGMEQQMMSAVQRYAADSVAGKCPHCGSHTTELIDEDGTSQCHGCHKQFKTEGKKPNTIHSPTSAKVAADDLPSATDDPPVQGVPMADQEHQRDLREERDSGHTWTDEEGNPLVVGQEYEMHSGKYDIPDLIRIEAVRPDSITYTLVGEYGFEHSTELTKQEANIERDTFRPAHSGDAGIDDGLESNDDDNTGYEGVPERTDSSAPVGLVSKDMAASGVTVQSNAQLSWLVRDLPKTAGANYTPMEQRVLIDEPGVARNADRLSLSGTHYVQDAEEEQFLFGY